MSSISKCRRLANTYEDMLKDAGLPPFLVSMLTDIQTAILSGALDVESDDFAALLDRPALPLEAALSEIVKEL